MKRHSTIFFLLLLLAFFLPVTILAGTIVSPHYYAWSNNVGYISFKDTVVGDSSLTGYAWSTNNGWIKMNPSAGGVLNDGQGNLSGYAWGENLGWINFSGVSIDSNGNFTGSASGDIVGTLTFDCTNCDVNTDWRVASSGGGGGTPPPNPDPDPEPPIEENLPTGAVQINSGALYSNNRNVTLQFGTDYVDSYAVANTNDFVSATYSTIVASASFTLPVGDGSKTVYVSFKNQYGSVVVSDSIILDTTAPSAPLISSINNGVVNGVATNPPSVYGTAEANSQIIITKTTVGAQTAGFSLADVSTYYTNTNGQGNWSFTFSSVFSPGNYAIAAKAQDAAGNISSSSLVSNVNIPVVVTLPEETSPDEVPPDETPPDEVPPDETDGNNNTGTDNTGTDNGGSNTTGGGSSNGGSGSTSSSTIEKIFTSSTIPNVIKNVTEVVDNVKKQATTITENVSKNISNSFKETGKVITKTAKFVGENVSKVVDNPEVEKVNKSVITPVVTTVAVVNVASSGFGFVNIINFFRVFFGQFFLLFRRKKQKKWGVLYNSFTKKPIDLASVRLIDLTTNKVVKSVVTDMDGRYILSAQPGNYKIQINKNGYSDFSVHLKDLSEDSAFINLYHGENIKVTDASEINYNIPLDPVDEHKSYLQIMKDKAHKVVRLVLSSIGLVFSVVSFAISPVWWVGVLVIFQFLLYGIIRRFAYKKLPSSFGVITSHTEEKPLSNVAVRVFEADFNKLVETTVSDRKGRYAVLLGPSKYYVTYEKQKYEKKKSPLLDFSSKITEGKGGILVRDEALKEEKSK